MSDPGRRHASWQVAAELAPFALYELHNAQARWAGGFMGDGSHVEIIGLLDGDEVAVESSGITGTPQHTMRQRAALADLLWHHVLENSVELDLPYPMVIEADDREVTIDGTPRTCRGIRVAGDLRWVGFVDLDNVVLRISTKSRAPLSLRRCTDLTGLPDSAPTSR